MKKLISIVLTMVLLFSVGCFSAVNSAATDELVAPVFSLSQKETSNGFLKIDFNLVSGLFNSLDVKLEPSQGLKCTDIEKSEICNANGIGFTNPEATGVAYHFSIVSSNGYSAPGTIFTATFEITNSRLDSYSVTFKIGDCTVTKIIDGEPENISVKPTTPVFSKKSLDIVVTSLPKRTTYCIGESLNTSGLTVTAEYLNGESKEIKNYDLKYDFSTQGKKAVAVSYSEGRFDAATSFEVTVNDHKPGELKTVQKATCTIDGINEQYCTVCNKLCHSEKIAATGHNYSTVTLTLPTYKTTGESKTYCTICNTVTETKTLPKCNADIDGNGTITSRDALEILQHATDLKQLTGEALANADLDGSGTIKSADALVVLQLATGLIKA